MLDSLLHRSVVIKLDGESYRLRDRRAAARTLCRTTIGTRQQLHRALLAGEEFGEHSRGFSMSAVTADATRRARRAV